MTTMTSTMTSTTVTLTTTTVVRTVEQELSKEDRIVITFTALGTLLVCIICGCCIDRIRILLRRTRQALPELTETQDIAKVMRRFSMLGAEDFPTQLQDTAESPPDVDSASIRSRESHKSDRPPEAEEQRQAMPHEIREAASAIEERAAPIVQPPKQEAAAAPDVAAPALASPAAQEDTGGDARSYSAAALFFKAFESDLPEEKQHGLGEETPNTHTHTHVLHIFFGARGTPYYPPYCQR